MNRKNLTAAVLAGLAGAAGIAGTAQAVNINPDGLGQVLIYPYFTTNDGNQTVLSVVNTTNHAKAVKVRFLEGFNSREVLDFNLYMSHHDVWVAAIFDDAGTPSILTADTSCTVPDIQGGYPGVVGTQEFLPFAYTGKNDDDGPQGIERAAEGYFEVIEMATLKGDAADDATHDFQVKKDSDGNIVDEWWGPNDCEALSDRWDARAGDDAIWLDEADAGDDQAITDSYRNSGGLFGGAAVVNTDNGTMFSYDAIAIQGFDKTDDGIHFEPGTINPSLNDGSEYTATVFFGVPQNRAVDLDYPSSRSVMAISALFMHEHIMNEYVTDPLVAASTEWVVTFPTKAWHVDETLFLPSDFEKFWFPDPDDPGCGWVPGDDNPLYDDDGNYLPGCGDPNDCPPEGWEQCTFDYVNTTDAMVPFTELWDGEACEGYGFDFWDREEGPDYIPGGPGGPIFSPPPPPPTTGKPPVYEFCYEVNVLRFGDGVIFGTPEDLEGSSLLTTVTLPTQDGWALIDFGADSDHVDWTGLVGLPATGFAANEYENQFLGGGSVKAFYGGLFQHKGNVRRVDPR